MLLREVPGDGIEVRVGRVVATLTMVGGGLLAWLAWVGFMEGSTAGIVVAGLAGWGAVVLLDRTTRQLAGAPVLVADASGVSLLRSFGRRELIRWGEIGAITPVLPVDSYGVALWRAGQTPGNLRTPRATVGVGFSGSRAIALADRLDHLRRVHTTDD